MENQKRGAQFDRQMLVHNLSYLYIHVPMVVIEMRKHRVVFQFLPVESALVLSIFSQNILLSVFKVV